ncbi:MAG: hypothetical protein ACOC4I_03560, partial [Spirochaetota bacterium]
MNEPLILGSVRLSITPVELAVEFALPSVLVFIVVVVLRRALRRHIRDASLVADDPAAKPRGVPAQLVRIISRLVCLAGFVVVIALAARLLGAEISLILSSIRAFLSEPLYDAGGTSISLLTIIFAIPILSFAVWRGNGSRGLLDRTLKENL